MKTLRRDHFLELDGMRGVLATAVMLFHYGLSTLITQISRGALRDSNWGLCVDFFFLLSGFVLCHSFMRRPVSASEFLWRRILRLVPMYLTATTLSLLVVPDRFSDFDIATNLALLQPIFGTWPIDFPAWSVPPELYLPFLAVAAAPFVGAMSRTGATIALATAIMIGSLACYLYQFDIDLQLTRAIAGLSGGALLYYRRMTAKRIMTSGRLTLCAFAGVISIMMISGVLPALSLLFYPCAIVAIWFGAHSDSLFSARPFQALGRWSYSIYLLHVPVLAAAQLWTGSTLQGAAFFKAALVVATILLAALTYRAIERPTMRTRSGSVTPALAREILS